MFERIDHFLRFVLLPFVAFFVLRQAPFGGVASAAPAPSLDDEPRATFTAPASQVAPAAPAAAAPRAEDELSPAVERDRAAADLVVELAPLTEARRAAEPAR